MSLWTIEEVAEFCEITVGQVYESRRRKEYPGVLGRQRGRRLLFSQDLVEAGPGEPETTDDVNTAILWALQGIKRTLDAMHNELRAQRPRYFDGELLETITTTVDVEMEEE
jgi:hypothetical protein